MDGRRTGTRTISGGSCGNRDDLCTVQRPSCRYSLHRDTLDSGQWRDRARYTDTRDSLATRDSHTLPELTHVFFCAARGRYGLAVHTTYDDMRCTPNGTVKHHMTQTSRDTRHTLATIPTTRNARHTCHNSTLTPSTLDTEPKRCGRAVRWIAPPLHPVRAGRERCFRFRRTAAGSHGRESAAPGWPGRS